jgi:hypothetical protein
LIVVAVSGPSALKRVVDKFQFISTINPTGEWLMKKPSFKLWFVVGAMLALSVTYWAGCSKTPNEPTTQETILSQTSPQAKAVMAVQDRYTDNLMAHPEVVGTAIGLTEDGKPAIVVLTKSEMSTKAGVRIESLRKGVAPVAIPAAIENLPVVVLVTGEIKALKGGGGGFDPTLKHRPAPNGVSLGHFDITAGTLGCLVNKNNTTYILSNNHVMANQNQASLGDNVLQPGPYDGGQNPGDAIATLSEFQTIVFSTSANNVIDAAIAAVNPNDVTGATADEGNYGAPSTTVVAAAVGMDVKKCGRTTGCTSTSTTKTNEGITAINATVNVGYDFGTARFINQIVITKRGFSAGGDSGSLVVDLNANPVGLLFAGSTTTTIANPIGAVLSHFGVSLGAN